MPKFDILDLEKVYELCENGDTDAAADIVFDKIDRALCDRRFDEINEVLKKVQVKRLTTSLMRSFLCMTHCAKHRLPYYNKLYEDIEQEMILLRGQPATSRILKNLK